MPKDRVTATASAVKTMERYLIAFLFLLSVMLFLNVDANNFSKRSERKNQKEGERLDLENDLQLRMKIAESEIGSQLMQKYCEELDKKMPGSFFVVLCNLGVRVFDFLKIGYTSAAHYTGEQREEILRFMKSSECGEQLKKDYMGLRNELTVESTQNFIKKFSGCILKFSKLFAKLEPSTIGETGQSRSENVSASFVNGANRTATF